MEPPQPIRTDLPFDQPYGPEKDSCAIYMSARKHGQSTFGTMKRALGALVQMGHRTGFVNGEGDGAGVQTDIPRRLWAKKLSQMGLNSSLATQPGFWVGHLFVPHTVDFSTLREEVVACFNANNLNLLILNPGRVRPETLGRETRANEPSFWQIAGYSEAPDLEKRLFHVQLTLEANETMHFASLSSYTVVYKLRGSVEALARYYPDLQDRDFDTAMVVCHARYSTNTVSNFERAQPFSLLGHNGEINTISRLRQEAEQIGVILPPDGSDSQDLDRTLQFLCVEDGLDLMEAMEMVFPPTPFAVKCMPPDMGAAYQRVRQAFGPYAQGPAAVVARYGDTIVSSVDALGLRPLWFIETEKEYIFCSERGAVPMELMVRDCRPLAPGEKMALRLHRAGNADIYDHTQVRRFVMSRMFQREADQLASRYWLGKSLPQPAAEPAPAAPSSATAMHAQPLPPVCQPNLNACVLAANGWMRDHLEDVQSLAASDNDPVSSLGFDGPLAALSRNRVNLADFYKEFVAVVTNPAVDRGRELEAFSTSSMIGACAGVGEAPNTGDVLMTLDVPVLLDDPVVASRFDTHTLEQLVAAFRDKLAWLTLGVLPGETTRSALDRLGQDAIELVQNGVQCLVLDDSQAIQAGNGWLDPHLAMAALDECLRKAGGKHSLRRRVGIVIRSASIRSLHDIILLSGFGADAVVPYAMFGVALGVHEGKPVEDAVEQAERLTHLMNNLKKGIEKVISTMGCHELRGYGRVCSSIGIAPSVAAVLRSPNYFGSEKVGVTWDWLDREAAVRAEEVLHPEKEVKFSKIERFLPYFWKKAGGYANLECGYGEIQKTYQQLSAESPVALRHILGVKHVSDIIDPIDVDIAVSGYNLPLIIEAMSFGSLGEIAYKAFARAASQLNIICMNGEGGELPEMIGVDNCHRGQQVASARFGVNVTLLNSAAVIEIKIGQGAKPGEGGMLPAYKISPQVAAARHTPPWITLLSPSNNHDLYSIEDLAQLIEELKMVNPLAKISVKCPVVPGIGVIAVGVAKAGADIINLSGYDGGTGAARRHALQHVGLPAEIGVIQAHRALTEAGLRHKVELWCDGGMKTGEDALKMVLLGANRVGFATMALIAAGCTTCRCCNEGTCHKGITTQIKTVEEAKEKGLRSFTPLDFDDTVRRVVRLFKGIGEEMRQLTAQLGSTNLQDLVGRSDLLEQVRLHDHIDLSSMLTPTPRRPRPQPEPGVGRLLTRPRNSLTRFLSELILETISEDEREVTYQDSVMAYDRAIGSHLVGEMIRQPQLKGDVDVLHLRFGPSSVAGNGFAAWVTDQLNILIEGGAQDGVAKGACGGRVAVMKGVNHEGVRMDGSVGKSFAYGAQNGILIVQGNADSRACIRLSGATVILAGEICEPIRDEEGSIGTRSNLKGFACEYMTSGRVIIFGDPGPYAFAGMTGGVVYQLLTPDRGFDAGALQRRLALGAHVTINPLVVSDHAEIREMIGYYAEALDQTYQYDMAEEMRARCRRPEFFERFVKILPKTEQGG